MAKQVLTRDDANAVISVMAEAQIQVKHAPRVNDLLAKLQAIVNGEVECKVKEKPKSKGKDVKPKE